MLDHGTAARSVEDVSGQGVSAKQKQTPNAERRMKEGNKSAPKRKDVEPLKRYAWGKRSTSNAQWQRRREKRFNAQVLRCNDVTLLTL